MALQQMNVEQITATMDKFEEQFGELDVRTGYMNSAMAGATATLTPEDDVDTLMQAVADEHGLQLAREIDTAGAVPSAAPAVQQQQPADAEAAAEQQMEERLAKLRAELA